MRLTKDAFWSVDPLDGTMAFIESKPGYAVSIGLVARHLSMTVDNSLSWMCS